MLEENRENNFNDPDRSKNRLTKWSKNSCSQMSRVTTVNRKKEIPLDEFASDHMLLYLSCLFLALRECRSGAKTSSSVAGSRTVGNLAGDGGGLIGAPSRQGDARAFSGINFVQRAGHERSVKILVHIYLSSQNCGPCEPACPVSADLSEVRLGM